MMPLIKLYLDKIPVIRRVPQGTILGLILFSMYINVCTIHLKNLLTLYACAKWDLQFNA